MKYTKFSDIPQLTRPGSWECNYSLDSVWRQVIEWQNEVPKLDIDPDFQREHVWTEEQQVAWLEFILRGGKTSRVLYFNAGVDWSGPFLIVDGKQRLEAIRRFVTNEIKVFGSYRHEYTDRNRSHNTMLLNVNNLRTRADVLQWYLEFGKVVIAPVIKQIRSL